MELSTLVAQIYGLICLMLGVGILLNGKYYKKTFEAIMKSPIVAFFGGLMAFAVGFLLIKYHNIWEGGVTVIAVSVIGWLALIKGVMLIIAPKSLLGFSRAMFKNTKVLGIFVLIFGLALSYLGFFG